MGVLRNPVDACKRTCDSEYGDDDEDDDDGDADDSSSSGRHHDQSQDSADF